MAIDGEWGLGMCMKFSIISFLWQFILGVIQDNSLIYEMGIEIVWQMKLAGIYVNFVLVVDVNNNVVNLVINNCFFGEDWMNVVAKSWWYVQGMQDNGMMACVKYFLGYGDIDVDFYYDFLVIWYDYGCFDSIEFFFFW